MRCAQCGDRAEDEMVKHAKKNKQDVLCKGCDDYFSGLGKKSLLEAKPKN